MESARLRDPMSGLTHCIGAVLALAGMIVLVHGASHPVFKPWHVATFSIFGCGMILLYSASTIYHWVNSNSNVLRKIDHMMIFILIASTYTPICLIPLKGPWGWFMFGGIWLLAVAGIVFKFFWIDAPRRVSSGIYVLMGWFAIVGIYPLYTSIMFEAFSWLVAGGLMYSAGAVIYARKRPDPWPDVFGFHEIFHIFVLLGTGCHFWVMYRYIMQCN